MRVMFQTHLEGKCAFSKHHVDFQNMVDFVFQSLFFEGFQKKHACFHRNAHLITRYLFYCSVWNSIKKRAFLLFKTINHRKNLSHGKMRVLPFEMTSFYENHQIFTSMWKENACFFFNFYQHLMIFVKTCYFRWKMRIFPCERFFRWFIVLKSKNAHFLVEFHTLQEKRYRVIKCAFL